MDYKIAQIAKLLSVSRQSIYSKLDNPYLQPHLKKIDNVTYVDSEGVEVIKSLLSCKVVDSQSNSQPESELTATLQENLTALKDLNNDYINSLRDEVTYLRSQLDAKDDQLKTKDELLKNFQVLLKQEQDRFLLLEDNFEQQEEKPASFWSRLFKRINQ